MSKNTQAVDKNGGREVTSTLEIWSERWEPLKNGLYKIHAGMNIGERVTSYPNTDYSNHLF
jgi:hypothetical protein